ncbi:small metal-binding protein SmbP [Candidatus Nitrospira neomarina]|uniref:Small metal-binding protein SmbP n=1 Tax=Candidatus Nitrospira neomarina TaxID=3020899 RepID=A0AA96GHY0_9BACT|nr:small metal-binding protein SmbP [Candidatus Nitrospira neomarina]WNM61808.1 small metal-binding protein SmbP [Candidatus Nitrospira neomarina]
MKKQAVVRGIGLFAILGLLIAGSWGSVALAGANPHVAEAIAHAEGAADHGGQGHADALVEHAQEALTHAQAAQKDVKNPHLDEGVHELMEAVEHGKAGHADVGTKHAKSAVMHLKEVK